MTAGAIAVPSVMPLRLPIAGKNKNCIDSNTRIEIRSETPLTKVYYTVDNTRPDPDKKLGENTTLLYREPFMLRDGKRYVKALARTKDGRESNVVTKVFNVEYAEPLSISSSEICDVDDLENFQREMDHREKVESKLMTSSILSGGGPVKGMEAWNDVHDPSSFRSTRMDFYSPAQSPRSYSKSVSPTKREKLVRCVHCDAQQPSSSSSRFCVECGKPIPVNPDLYPGESGTMGMCIKCRSYVPLNQTKCIVCEEPIGPKLRPVSSVRLQDEIICGSCGSRSPSHLTHCASCEHRFPAPIHAGTNSTPLPRLDGELVRCPSCSRVNNPDARFCDWCGEKPIPEQSPMACSLCKHNNRPYSKFCSQCGSKFVAPDRMDPRNQDLGSQLHHTQFDKLPMWSTIPLPTLPRSPPGTKIVRAAKPPCREVQTQTVGMFYPGGKKVNQEQEMMQELMNREMRMRDKQPPLTAVSPGRGFWRKQMDHICGHLRGYTNNNVEFRSVIGEPRLGKILGTAIDEGEEEIILSVTFALKGHTEFGDGGHHGLQRDLYTSKKKVAFGSTMVDNQPEAEKSGKKTKKKSKKKSSLAHEEKMNPEDRLIIKELGPRGEGRADEVKQLIKEGADPNCLDPDKRAALSVAVRNKRPKCVRALLEGGADVNVRSGPQRDTALHQAVKLGPDGKDIIKILLDFDGRTDVKNERGLSAYDTAVRADYNTIVALFNEPKGSKGPKVKARSPKKKKKVSDSSSSESDSDLF